MSDFVEAYSKTTGKKQIIPKAWLDNPNPPFNDFELSKRAQTAVKAASVPEKKETK